MTESGPVPALTQPSPHRRHRLLILPEAQRDQLRYDAPDVNRDPETWIVDYDGLMRQHSLPAALELLARRKILRPNQLYLLSPYDDAYIPAYEAEEAFALRKFELFTRLCFLLGAKQVKAQRTDRDESARTQQGQLDVGRLGVRTNASMETGLREKLEQQTTMLSKFEGGPPDVDAAVALLDRHGLDQDSSMRGLVDLFRHGTNRVRAQEFRLNVTSEASRELKAAASLNVPKTLAISASFRDLKTHVQELILELVVTF